ncbi:hypothetical protein CsatA_020293 [Cannabis sativa]
MHVEHIIILGGVTTLLAWGLYTCMCCILVYYKFLLCCIIIIIVQIIGIKYI